MSKYITPLFKDKIIFDNDITVSQISKFQHNLKKTYDKISQRIKKYSDDELYEYYTIMMYNYNTLCRLRDMNEEKTYKEANKDVETQVNNIVTNYLLNLGIGLYDAITDNIMDDYKGPFNINPESEPMQKRFEELNELGNSIYKKEDEEYSLECDDDEDKTGFFDTVGNILDKVTKPFNNN